jgi:hypothetical protein
MKPTFLFMMIMTAILLACSPAVSVFHDYDRDKDIQSYATYDWKAVDGVESNQNPIYYNELNDKRIKTATDKVFVEKGYQHVSDAPSLLLHYHIIVEDKSIVTMDPNEHQFSPYWMREEMSTYQYKEGTLILDLMDAETNELVWRGWAVGTLEDLRPEHFEKKLVKTIERILEPLPTHQ